MNRKKWEDKIRRLDEKYIFKALTTNVVLSLTYLGWFLYMEFFSGEVNTWKYTNQQMFISVFLIPITILTFIGYAQQSKFITTIAYGIMTNLLLLYYAGTFKAFSDLDQQFYFSGFFRLESDYFLYMASISVAVLAYFFKWRINFLIGMISGYWVMMIYQLFTSNNDSLFGKLIYIYSYAGTDGALKQLWLILLVGFLATLVGTKAKNRVDFVAHYEKIKQLNQPKGKQPARMGTDTFVPKTQPKEQKGRIENVMENQKKKKGERINFD